MKTRYIFIALFASFIMIDVISFFFNTVAIYDNRPSIFEEGENSDAFYSVISMFSSASSDDFLSALSFCSVILGPIITLIVVGTMKAPMRVVWKVLFIIYFLINLLHSLFALFVMTFDLWGPMKSLTLAGWIPIAINTLSAIFLFVMAVGKPIAGAVLKPRMNF